VLIGFIGKVPRNSSSVQYDVAPEFGTNSLGGLEHFIRHGIQQSHETGSLGLNRVSATRFRYAPGRVAHSK